MPRKMLDVWFAACTIRQLALQHRDSELRFITVCGLFLFKTCLVPFSCLQDVAGSGSLLSCKEPSDTDEKILRGQSSSKQFVISAPPNDLCSKCPTQCFESTFMDFPEHGIMRYGRRCHYQTLLSYQILPYRPIYHLNDSFLMIIN